MCLTFPYFFWPSLEGIRVCPLPEPKLMAALDHQTDHACTLRDEKGIVFDLDVVERSFNAQLVERSGQRFSVLIAVKNRFGPLQVKALREHV